MQYMPVISALGKQRQENGKFKSILGYLERPCLKKQTNKCIHK
jgi:hypothetical protein